MMSDISKILRDHPDFANVISGFAPFRKLDFSEANRVLLTRDLLETDVFTDFVFCEMLSYGKFIGVGGYGENRVIYLKRKHFTNEQGDPRTVHLGTDIWAKAGTPVFAPLDASVHSFAFNNQYGDYGPTIILEHLLHGQTFFTLYGHLSLDSISGLFEGKRIPGGEQIGSIGGFPENGDWPPHLHFQVIGDMLGYHGDFPGVCTVQDWDYYSALCPDPNLILRIKENG